MCPGLYLFQIETGQSWDLFPCVCQLCLGPLGSSKAPASCFAKARPWLGLVWHSLWCPGTKPHTFPIGAHDRVGSLDIPQQGSEAYSYSQPVLVPENRAAGGLRYSWGLSVTAVPRPLQRTSPPRARSWELPSALPPQPLPPSVCPLGVTGIPKVLPPFHLS